MSYKLHFEIKGYGLSKLTNNMRANWGAQHKETKKWKNAVMEAVCLGKYGLPESPLKKAHLTLTRHSSREPDYDGLVSSFKRVIDGLINAGVLENDKMSNIGIPDYRWKKAPINKGFIEVEVEER